MLEKIVIFNEWLTSASEQVYVAQKCQQFGSVAEEADGKAERIFSKLLS